MRISLTVLTAQGPTDVVVNGDSEMTVESVARALSETLTGVEQSERSAQPLLAQVLRHPATPTSFGPPESSRPGALWMNGRMLDPAARAAKVLRDGAVVTADPAAAPATVLAEPAGLVEVRVAGGPA